MAIRSDWSGTYRPPVFFLGNLGLPKVQVEEWRDTANERKQS